ncbi:chemotaxis protein methyltransferase CheR [Desulfocicer vacuolatum DSM 3385]|uniref:protein-glutamate O-methyltransferase n=1 Tax=Desulfocicer vacuolatum DSM 3385 TaxID=1121400 RepID=A0A1W2EIU3_9BACT|nr:protein-glutamate O-methyltransferase CheR [Desulfocicer vacuolatum]SMD09525.1 chemotaxis protein methyltransferase CheR [Desulfocicer vacuolatum DSM 3385]
MDKITPAECALFSKYICEVSGISVDPAKAYLFETRLGGLLKELRISSYEALHGRARADATRKLEQQIIDRIATNETLFFRDEKPFELLRHKILPDLIDKRAPRCRGGLPIPIRIWSAACATGQEIYSIAIVLKELLPDLKQYNIRLLATDISGKAIARASSGRFNQFEMGRGLPKDMQQKYFTLQGGDWQINDEIRAMVAFRKLNLLHPFAGLGKFDIILLRNVAIYFNIETRKKVFQKICGVLENDGYLIIGSTESLTSICPDMVPRRYLKSIFYQPQNGSGV